jgi:hypothetical protein
MIECRRVRLGLWGIILSRLLRVPVIIVILILRVLRWIIRLWIPWVIWRIWTGIGVLGREVWPLGRVELVGRVWVVIEVRRRWLKLVIRRAKVGVVAWPLEVLVFHSDELGVFIELHDPVGRRALLWGFHWAIRILKALQQKYVS